MDKRITKQDFIKEIRQHLKALGVRKGERLEINETVSRQRVTMGEKVYNNEIRVKSVTSTGVFLNGTPTESAATIRANTHIIT